MALINTLLRSLVDALLTPFRGMPAIVGLAAVSLGTAVAMLLVFRATSNQAGLAAVKRSIHASLFEMRLFSDDLGAMFRAQWELLRHNGTYLRLSLVPVLWMFLPILLLVIQLQFHYAYGGLRPGERAVVGVQFRTGVPHVDGSAMETTLAAPPGLLVETPGVWIPSLREVAWGIAPEKPGDYEIVVNAAGQAITKSVRVSEVQGRRSPMRVGASWWDQILYPAEPPIPSGSPVAAIRVNYPGRDIDVFGWEVHWMIVYFVLTMAFALGLRRPLRVVF